MRLTCDVVLTI